MGGRRREESKRGVISDEELGGSPRSDLSERKEVKIVDAERERDMIDTMNTTKIQYNQSR